MADVSGEDLLDHDDLADLARKVRSYRIREAEVMGELIQLAAERMGCEQSDESLLAALESIIDY